MNKRLLAAIISVFLFASPLLVSAQSTGLGGQSNAFLIAELTQLVHLLEQELQQLLAAQGGTTVAAPTISSFSASPSSITQGQSATLTWSESNATSLSISGIGTVTGSSVQVSPSQTTTYTLTATNSSGSVIAQTTVTVSSGTSGASFTATPTSGTAPLTTTFTVMYSCGGQILLFFGDGTSQYVGSCSTVSHTYQSAGTYTASLINGGVLGTAITITVTGGNPPPTPAPTVSYFTASPSSITAGQSATLSWSASNATTLSISGIGTVTGSSVQVSPSQTTTYTLTATNNSGSVTAQTTVTVGSGNNGITLTATPTSGSAPLTVTFTAGRPGTLCFPGTPPTLSFGDGTSQVVYWCSTVSHTYTAAGTYTATLTNVPGGPTLGSATITVTGGNPPPTPAPTVSYFTASPSSITAGQSTTLSWSASNATTLSISGIGTVTGSSVTVTPSQTTTYILTATNSSGSVTAAATVTVGSGNNGVTPTSGTAPLVVTVTVTPVGLCGADELDFGDGTNQYIGCTSTVSHTYQTAGTYTVTLISDIAGVTLDTLGSITVTGGNPPPTPAPTVSYFTASPSSITAGQSTTLSWSASNATTLSISGIGTVTGSSVTVTPSQTTTYSLTATNSTGSVTAQTTVTVTSGGGGGGNTSAITCLKSLPTGLTQLPPAELWYSTNTGLTVQFVTISIGGWGGISINFGDGSTPLSNIQSSGLSCSSQTNGFITWTHTYPAAGTYTLSGNFNGISYTYGQIPVTGPTSAAADPNANLANALTALESALEAFLGAH